MIDKKKLFDILHQKNLISIGLISHTSVDPDAFAALFGLEFLLRQVNPKLTIDVFIDGISESAKELINYYKKDYLTKIEKEYDLLILIDVNVLTQLGNFEKIVSNQKKEKLIIIDHHVESDFSKNGCFYSYIDDERTSTAEIITELIFNSQLKPESKLLTILLAGILYDSRRFYSLTENLLKIILKMFEFGVDYDKAINLIQRKYENSERIARIKCASRLELKKMGKWLFVWSSIGSFEGSAARALLDIGADVAIIYLQRNNETRLNVRATSNFFEETKINFGGEIMNQLSKLFNGDGGGHSTAAALNIPNIILEIELKKVFYKIIEKQIQNSVIEKIP